MYKISKLAVGSVMAASAALGGTSMVLADGYEPKGRVIYERPSDWSGVYFGVGSGYQWSSIDVVNPDFPANGITSDHRDMFVAAHLGAQHQFGSFVLGLEGGWASSIRDKEGSFEACFNHAAPVAGATGGTITGGPVLNPTTTPGTQAAGLTSGLNASCNARFNDVITVGPRIGWAAGRWMPYVTGGYANAGFDFQGRGPATTSTATSMIEEAHKRLNGWYIGGGVEWNISPGWTAGIEYRHYDFGEGHTTAFHPGAGVSTVAAGLPLGIPTGTPLENVRFDATTETVTARVTWKFSREVVVPLK